MSKLERPNKPLAAYVYEDAGSYVAEDKNGRLITSDADFGTMFNYLMTALGSVGIVGIEGGTTYTYGVTPTVTGSGSYNEKPIEIIGVGDGAYPVLEPDDGVVGFDYEHGVNLHLHRLHIDQSTSGAGVPALRALNDGGNAYLENGAWLAKFGDLILEGGVSGQNLWYAEDMEWFHIYGRIIAKGGTGVHPIKFVNTAAAEFSYFESLVTGQVFVTTTGANTVAMELSGDSSKPLNLLNWKGQFWLRNSGGSDGTIGLKTGYVQRSEIGGLHIENMNILLQQNTGTQSVRFNFGNSYSFNCNGTNKIGCDMNSGYNNTVDNFLFYFGGLTAVAIDDENDDANAPHRYSNLTLQGSGGVCTYDLGSSAMTDTPVYRRLGSGTFP